MLFEEQVKHIQTKDMVNWTLFFVFDFISLTVTAKYVTIDKHVKSKEIISGLIVGGFQQQSK